jgi:hypothetical protein
MIQWLQSLTSDDIKPPSDDQAELVARTEICLTQCLDLANVADFEADVEIDDYNEPVVENIPTINTTNNAECTYSDWKHNVMCPRRLTGMIDPAPILEISNKPTVLDPFECLFPVDDLNQVVIPVTNKHLDKQLS